MRSSLWTSLPQDKRPEESNGDYEEKEVPSMRLTFVMGFRLQEANGNATENSGAKIELHPDFEGM